MAFEKYEAGSGRGSPSRPEISLRQSGSIGINSRAMTEWFDDATAVNVYFDAETDTVGIEPLSQTESGSYSLSQSDGSGSVAATGFLTEYDLIPEETTTYPAQWDDEHEMVVATLSEDQE